jgi:hypothetical protein
VTDGERILNVGCGTGSLIFALCALGSAQIGRVQVPPALGWGAPYPKAGVMPRWPKRVERYGDVSWGTKAKAGNTQDRPGAATRRASEDRVSAARRDPKGMRRSTGL